MSPPPGDADGLLGRRSSLPPSELIALTDALVLDQSTAWRMIGVSSPPPSSSSLSDEEISRWLDILDDARDLEIADAPSLGEYLRGLTGSAAALAGLGFAFTGPVFGSVVATTGLIVGGVGGLITFWDTGRLIYKDSECARRLRAIDAAKELLRDIG